MNQNLLQCRYEPKQFYKPHHDYFADTVSLRFCFHICIISGLVEEALALIKKCKKSGLQCLTFGLVNNVELDLYLIFSFFIILEHLVWKLCLSCVFIIFLVSFLMFSKQFNLKRGGQRVATMLMYLTDDVEGGETYFPLV